MEKTIIIKKQFKHEDDSHLFIVLAEWKGEFIVWTYNSESKGFSHGHYYNDLGTAQEKYLEQVVKYC